ncbi:MAG: dTDP-glucose 4,6-dehydratase [Phycisphaerae bacterium]
MKRILVTGGAGFIGSHFLDLLVEKQAGQIICLDAFTYAGDIRNLETVKDRIEVVRGDIRNMDDLRKVFSRGIDTVVNFAAETHVDNSIEGPVVFVDTNVTGTLRLLMCALEYGVEKFLHISTDEVYGSRAEGYFKEEDAHYPSSPYAASKSAAEQLCHAYHVTYHLPVLVARSTNNYGPRQHGEKFIPTVIRNCLNNSPIPVYGKGTNQRDWMYVRDNVQALLLILQNAKPGDVFNVGANCHLPNLELAKRLVKISGSDEKLIKFVEDRKGHDFRYAVDTQKISTLGWKPHVDLDTGLRLTFEWYKQRHNAS